MIPGPVPLDKYDTRARPVPLWVPTMRIPVGIEVSMGTHGFLIFFFGTNNNKKLITKKLQLLNIHT